MNKNVKTTLTVALCLFGVGVIICLCTAVGLGFDFSKLSFGSRYGSKSNTSVEMGDISKSIADSGQSITVNLSSADVTVEKSTDDNIHISYTNTDKVYFDIQSDGSKIVLTQHVNGALFFDIDLSGNEKGNVIVTVPSGHEGDVSLNSASGNISVSGIEVANGLEPESVSGKVIVQNCKAQRIKAASTSGNIKLTALETDVIDGNTVSGSLSVSEISGGIPLSLETTSGEVYAEDVKATELNVGTVSGAVSLKDLSGHSLKLSTTSGDIDLTSADFTETVFTSISGHIKGTILGSYEDYTIRTSTLSGNSNLPTGSGKGDRTLDLTTTSGDMEISFLG